MYHYPAHYEARYEYPADYLNYKYEPKTRVTTTRYYIGNPYITSYTDGRFELLRRTPIYSSSADLGLESLRNSRAISIPPRASSIPPRCSSPGREELRRSIRASSVPPVETQELTPITPSFTRFTPKLATGSTPTPTYTYCSRVPTEAGDMSSDSPRRVYSANPMSFGPRIYTSLSVFPTMRYSSYNLMSPIDRYRYRTTPTKSYSTYPSTSYYSYPTPTSSTSSAYRRSDLYPTRFQINRVTYPSMERFYAGRRTLY